MQDVHNITAFFDERREADTAIGKLKTAGIPETSIRMVEGRDPSQAQTSQAPRDEGFMASLKEMFMGADSQDHDTYAEGLRRGGYLVSVRTPSADQDRVIDILDKDGSVDMDARSDSWRAEGWSGVPRAERPADGAPADGTIEVVEEDLRIGKRDVSHGRVRVHAHTVEEQVSEDVTLETERAEIDRRAVDREVSNPDAAFQDKTVEVEETAEEAVVEKTARVVEEIDVGKTVEHETENVSGTVRHTEVEIDDARKGQRKPKI